MTAFLKGPPLVVHIMIATMVNAFFFPLIYDWTGSILYGFLVSVAFLAVYGLLVLWLARPRHTPEKNGEDR
jgi:undecaprenyl pyrophosphate phosphatase UppP